MTGQSQTPSARSHTHQAGIATLELVLTLPLVLALIVAMVWLGFSLVGQVEVTVAARHAAWGERFGSWSGRAFDFNDENPLEARESQLVNVTPMLSSEAGPESQHTVEQGNWDYRNVEFGSAPNLKLTGQMLFAAKTVGVIADYEDLRETFGKLAGVGDAALGEALREIASELTGRSQQVESQGESAEQRTELERNLDEAKAEGNLRDLEAERDRLKQALKEAGDAEEDTGDQVWLLERQIERIEIEIELAEDRLDQF